LIKRILIVGFGSIGKRHLRLARELLPHAEIGVLRHKVELVVPEGADFIFATMSEALSFSPNLAIIASPAPFHLSHAIPLAEAGVHLLIEKPLSATSEGIEDLAEACNNEHVVISIGYNFRFLKSLQEFKFIIDSEVIGSVWSVRCEVGQYLPSWRPDGDYRKGVSAQNSLGGGVLLELSHEIDYLRWIFGEVDWVQATLTKQSDLEIDVEDTAHLFLGFTAKDLERQILASVNLDFIRQDTTRVCTVIGKLGSLRWNGIAGTIELWAIGTQGWQEIYRDESPRDESYIAEWKHLIHCIEQESKVMITCEDGLKVLQIIESARVASKTKSQVKIGSFNELREL
jgi:predicted dehydrogenase